jgi:hypothetical protein
MDPCDQYVGKSYYFCVTMLELLAKYSDACHGKSGSLLCSYISSVLTSVEDM